MFVMERQARARDRKIIRTASENVELIAVDGGKVRVAVNHRATVAILKRLHGFVEVEAVKPEPKKTEPKKTAEPSRRDELLAKESGSRDQLARTLQIKGRSKMGDEELVDAILEAESIG